MLVISEHACACSTGGLEAYGVDPAFNPHSSMYSSISVQNKWRHFNLSDNSPDISITGVPFAFHGRPSTGYDDGFPIFFPVLHSHQSSSANVLFC